MKNYRIIFVGLLIFGMAYLSGPSVQADQLFDGGGYGANYGNTNYNIPMPATPSAPTYSGTQQSNTYSKPTHTHHSSSLLTPQMRNDIVDSVYSQLQAQAKQKALAAQKQEEEKKKQEEAKKKKDAQNWLRDFQADSSPKIDNANTTIKLLDDLDPVRKLESSHVPPLGQTNNIENSEFNIPKQQPIVQAPTISKHDDSEFSTPGKTEGQLREMYYNSDREIMQCANGSKECSPEYVKSLQMKRLTAEQGLTIHYNYKNVGGNFIKKPQ